MNSADFIAKYFTEAFSVYRSSAITNNWGGASVEPQLHASYSGFFQTRSADKTSTNGKDEYVETLVLYAPITADIQPADEIRTASSRYKITFTQPVKGIGGKGRHIEVGLSYIGNVQS